MPVWSIPADPLTARPPKLSQPLASLVAMTTPSEKILVRLGALSGGQEPLVWVPIDGDGNDAGPPEVDYPPPAAPRLN